VTLQAVVLLGGIGTRLRPLTYAAPKQALPIVEVPMIERVLAHLLDHGVTGAVLSLGYLHEAFSELFPDGRYGTMDVRFAIEPEPLDTGGAIRFAALEAGIDERFLVINGDVLTDLDITAMLDFHESRDGAEGTIALAHVAEARVLQRIAAGRRVSVEREVFPGIAADRRLFAFPSAAYWTDTGTPIQYLQAQLDIVAGRRPGVPAPGAVTDGDGIWRMGRVTVDGEVRAPALLGVEAKVASGATVHNAIVGAGAGVDEGAVVEESVLLPGAWVAAGAVVRGSIVGPGAVIGERASVTDASIVGAGMKVEPGACLTGARFPDGPPAIAAVVAGS